MSKRTVTIFITSAIIASVATAVYLQKNQEPITWTQPAPVEIVCDLVCEVDKRTIVIFERNRDIYLEESRLEAIRELNGELTNMIYESPHINQDELDAKFAQ